jgi:polar amino acid transport system permease protein
VHTFLYTLEPVYALRTLPDVWAGLRLTLAVSAVGIAGALLVGTAGGALRAARVPVMSQALGLYVEAFRNTPLLVQIFFLYFGLPQLHVTLSAFTVAWLALVLWGGAYSLETFRAGFESVDRGLLDAARALGMGAWATFLFVVLPIGVRVALPSLTNSCISVLKNSSYMVAIGFPELTTTAVNIVSLNFRVVEVFGTVAAVYLLLVWSLSALAAAADRLLGLPEAA